MSKIKYKDFNFKAGTLAVIDQANIIIDEYEAKNLKLTLRQLYYQFVARAYIANKQTEYKRLGSIINDARLAGLIDWDAIEDRTRVNRSNPHWDGPADIIETCSRQFRLDTRADQDTYLEVWIEKEALAGILQSICPQLDVPYFACKGFVSQSSMYEAAERFIRETCYDKEKETWVRKGIRKGVLIHLGDHDPSGIDMTRDIQDRLDMFGARVTVKRIALNMHQIEQYNPPPNPAKVTDSRYNGYASEYGDESWELDALDPEVLIELIENTVNAYTQPAKRKRLIDLQAAHRTELKMAADRWGQIEDIL